MDSQQNETFAYLSELYNQTRGDLNASVSMYDLGTNLGLDKSDAGTLAEALLVQGFAELKSLSGGIGITKEGLAELQIEPEPDPTDAALTLGSDPVLTSQGKKNVTSMLCKIKSGLEKETLPYEQIEEIVIDIKTVETQMMSPAPKTDIIRSVFKSIQDSLSKQGAHMASKELKTMIES